MVLNNFAGEMCRVRVTYYGAIRGLVKRHDETVVLPKDSASVRKLLEILADEYGGRFQELTKYTERSSPLVTIFVNGQVVGDARDSEKPIFDGSEVEVSLINQMSGG